MPQVPKDSNLHVSAPAIDLVAKLAGSDGGKSLKWILPLSCSPSSQQSLTEGSQTP